MAMVKLGDVAIEKRETWTGSTQGVPIIGLEHLVPGEITLSSWDSDTDNTFSKMFRKDQVLLGRRRVYLKKAVIAPFDGICSGDITVIEAIPGKISPRLLPFIIQNERFFDYAIQGSAGSLSPRVKWEHLKDYEFNLSDYEEQESLANKLWSALKLKESYHALLLATDEMVKSRFIEITKSERTQHHALNKLTSIERKNVNPIRGTIYTLYSFPAYDNNRIPEVIDGGDIKSSKLLLTSNTVLYNKLNVRLRRVWNIKELKTNNNICSSEFIPLKVNKDVILQEYLMYCLTSDTVTEMMESASQGTSNSQQRISPSSLMQVSIPVIPKNEQKHFIELYQQSDKSKFELKQAIEKIDKVMRALLQ